MTVVVTETLRAVRIKPDSESGVLRMVSNRMPEMPRVLATPPRKEYSFSAERYLPFLCHNGFQAPTDLAGLMFWREVVKSGPLCRVPGAERIVLTAISRPAPPPPVFEIYLLRFRENCGRALARAVASAPLRIHIGPSAGGH